MDAITSKTDISEEQKIEIGNRLAKLRVDYTEKHKINQEDFGKLLGLGYKTKGSMQSNLSKIERGEVDYHIPLLQRYAKVCGTTLDYIISGVETRPIDTPDKAPEYTIAGLCKDIMKLDECGLIEFFTSTDDRYGILFRDIKAEMQNKDYGTLDGFNSEGESIHVPINPSIVDEIRAACSNTILVFLERYMGYKEAMTQLCDMPFGYSDQIGLLATQGLIKEIETFGNISINFLLSEVEDNKKDQGHEYDFMADSIVGGFSLPKDGEEIGEVYTFSGKKIKLGAVTKTDKGRQDEPSKDKGQQD